MKRTVIIILLVGMAVNVAVAKSVRKRAAVKKERSVNAGRATFDRAVEAYNADDLTTASSLLDEFLRSNPGDAYAWSYKAAILCERDEAEPALEAIERARECSVNESDTAMLNWMHYTRSTIHLQLRDTLACIDDLNMALRYNPADVDCYVRRGNLLMRLNRLDEAMVDYGYLVQLQPDQAEGYLGLGIIAGKLKKHKDAIKSYTAAIKLEPDLADCYAMRAVEYYNDWDWDNAARDVISALERDKENARALWVLEYLKRDAPEQLQKQLKNKAKKSKDDTWMDLLD